MIFTYLGMTYAYVIVVMIDLVGGRLILVRINYAFIIFEGDWEKYR